MKEESSVFAGREALVAAVLERHCSAEERVRHPAWAWQGSGRFATAEVLQPQRYRHKTLIGPGAESTLLPPPFVRRLFFDFRTHFKVIITNQTAFFILMFNVSRLPRTGTDDFHIGRNIILAIRLHR